MISSIKEKLGAFSLSFIKYFFPILVGLFFLYLQNNQNPIEINIARLSGSIFGLLFIVWIFMRRKWKDKKDRYWVALCWVFCIQSIVVWQRGWHEKQELSNKFPKTVAAMKSALIEIEKENHDENQIKQTFSFDDLISRFYEETHSLGNNFSKKRENLEKKHSLPDFFDKVFTHFFFNLEKSSIFLKDYVALIIGLKSELLDLENNQIESLRLLKNIHSDQKKSLDSFESGLRKGFSQSDQYWIFELKMVQELEKILSLIKKCKEKDSVRFDEKGDSLIFENTKDHTEYIRIFSSFYNMSQSQKKLMNMQKKNMESALDQLK